MSEPFKYQAIHNVGQFYLKPVIGIGGDNNLKEFRKFLREKWNAGRDHDRFGRGSSPHCEWSIKNMKTGEILPV